MYKRDTHLRDFGFSDWIRDECRHVMTVSDIDFIVYKRPNKSRRGVLFFIEQKSKMSEPSKYQKEAFNAINKRISSLPEIDDNVDYWGFYLIQFSNINPKDSDRIIIRKQRKRKEITLEELCRFMQGELKIL
jgi:hypothetical protein